MKSNWDGGGFVISDVCGWITQVFLIADIDVLIISKLKKVPWYYYVQNPMTTKDSFSALHLFCNETQSRGIIDAFFWLSKFDPYGIFKSVTPLRLRSHELEETCIPFILLESKLI
jgi:hypothetical protein